MRVEIPDTRKKRYYNYHGQAAKSEVESVAKFERHMEHHLRDCGREEHQLKESNEADIKESASNRILLD